MHLLNKAVSRISLITAAVAAFAVSAIAQTTGEPAAPDLDYTETIASTNTHLTTFFQTNGPVFMIGLVIVLGFGIVWKLSKRVAKSI